MVTGAMKLKDACFLEKTMTNVHIVLKSRDTTLKASILWHSAFFMVKFSHPYMTTRKTVALTIWTFVGKVMSLLLNILSRFVIPFLSRSK